MPKATVCHLFIRLKVARKSLACGCSLVGGVSEYAIRWVLFIYLFVFARIFVCVCVFIVCVLHFSLPVYNCVFMSVFAYISYKLCMCVHHIYS